MEKTHPRFNREWVECFITVVGVLFNHLRCPVGEPPSVFQMRVARPRPAVEICRAFSLGILPRVGNARTNPAGGCDSGPVGADLEPRGPLPHFKCEWAASISSCRNLLIFRFRDFKSEWAICSMPSARQGMCRPSQGIYQRLQRIGFEILPRAAPSCGRAENLASIRAIGAELRRQPRISFPDRPDRQPAQSPGRPSVVGTGITRQQPENSQDHGRNRHHGAVV